MPATDGVHEYVASLPRCAETSRNPQRTAVVYSLGSRNCDGPPSGSGLKKHRVVWAQRLLPSTRGNTRKIPCKTPLEVVSP
mmetsp:Transcript_51589/g.92063  ORF Transcript_51589/g.92063 Transcript_51589/m.92063 type:complete len:81 (-) Transcript_51589:42-284(-)